MKSVSFRRTGPLTLSIVLALAILVAACDAALTPTATPVPPTPTRAALPPTATPAPAAVAVTATKAPAAPTAAAAAPTATTAPAVATASFAKDVLPLFQKNCTRCHGGSSPRAGLSLNTYAAALKGSSNGAVVVAGDPDKSPVYTLVKSGVMPFGGAKLSDADAQLIFDWIKAGAPNN